MTTQKQKWTPDEMREYLADLPFGDGSPPTHTEAMAEEYQPRIHYKVETCQDCGAELRHGDCPVCDPWPEDEFED